MNNILELTPWQKKQATMLYHFASLEYLKAMHAALADLSEFTDSILNAASSQQRDAHLQNSRWGIRDTSSNWENNAWPLLKDFQLTTNRQIAERAFEKYNITGFNQFDRARSEYSMNWASQNEEETYQRLVGRVAAFARNIDPTLDKYSRASRWTDFAFSLAWEGLKGEFHKIPQFKIRNDIVVKTNSIPVRTGVYVSASDPNAALQFAWCGGTQGKLLLGATFNSLGESALAAIGRTDMWTNKTKMLEFATSAKTNPLIREDPFFAESLRDPNLAPSLVARNVKAEIECDWIFVEIVNNAYEDVADLEQSPQYPRLRIAAGEPCPVSGYYFTPAQPASRTFFKSGTPMPNVDSAYGATIWQWDVTQEK